MMSRLTTTINGYVDFADVRPNDTSDDLIVTLLNKLAAYEDTGLEPYMVEDYKKSYAYMHEQNSKQLEVIIEKDKRIAVLEKLLDGEIKSRAECHKEIKEIKIPMGT